MILQAIKISNKFYINNLFKILNKCAIPLIFISALSAYSSNLSNNVIFITIISTLFQIHLTCLLILVTSDIINNTSQSLANYYFKAIYYIVPLIGIGLFMGAVLLLGFMAFILPGIFLLGKFIFAQYSIVLDGKTITEAIELSWKIDSKKAWDIGLAIMSMVALWGFCIATISSYFMNSDNNINPAFIFISSLLSFSILNIYLNIFVITLFFGEKK
jgi:hypothetical protein|tara:strand:+ start:1914 stop:2561 length:648 start_codon:yes stop_codon:yes gene_type:complete